MEFDSDRIRPDAVRVTCAGGASMQRVLKALASDPAVGEALAGHMSASGFGACFWECPPVCATSVADEPFECMLVDAPALARVRADPAPFAEHIREPGDAGGVAVFASLGGDALLIAPRQPAAPSPGRDGMPDCAHLLAFLREAPAEWRARFWRVVATTTRERIGKMGERPTWLSTSGLGVYWLHVRLDSRPKYYTWAPYRSWPR